MQGDQPVVIGGSLICGFLFLMVFFGRGCLLGAVLLAPGPAGDTMVCRDTATREGA